jgi:hypothetical protein
LQILVLVFRVGKIVFNCDSINLFGILYTTSKREYFGAYVRCFLSKSILRFTCSQLYFWFTISSTKFHYRLKFSFISHKSPYKHFLFFISHLKFPSSLQKPIPASLRYRNLWLWNRWTHTIYQSICPVWWSNSVHCLRALHEWQNLSKYSCSSCCQANLHLLSFWSLIVFLKIAENTLWGWGFEETQINHWL